MRLLPLTLVLVYMSPLAAGVLGLGDDYNTREYVLSGEFVSTPVSGGCGHHALFPVGSICFVRFEREDKHSFSIADASGVMVSGRVTYYDTAFNRVGGETVFCGESDELAVPPGTWMTLIILADESLDGCLAGIATTGIVTIYRT